MTTRFESTGKVTSTRHIFFDGPKASQGHELFMVTKPIHPNSAPMQDQMVVFNVEAPRISTAPERRHEHETFNITIPLPVLLEVVADVVRQHRIDELCNAEADEILFLD